MSRAAPPDLGRLQLPAHGTELERRPAVLHVPGLVLPLVVLQRQRLARADEEQLACIAVGLRPDQLPAPGLLDSPRLGLHGTPSQSGLAATWSCATRRSFGVLTVIQRPSCRYARSLRSAASVGNVVVSWSPFSGSRSSASSPRT